MKYFGTFVFAHHPSTDKARSRKEYNVSGKDKTTE